MKMNKQKKSVCVISLAAGDTGIAWRYIHPLRDPIHVAISDHATLAAPDSPEAHHNRSQYVDDYIDIYIKLDILLTARKERENCLLPKMICFAVLVPASVFSASLLVQPLKRNSRLFYLPSSCVTKRNNKISFYNVV